MSVNATFTQKVRRGIFNPAVRHLSNPVTREDRLQEGICLAWDQYRRRAEEGRFLDDALLVHICRLRAVDLNRSIVPASRRSRRRDVLDPRAFSDGKVELSVFDETGHAVLGCPDPEPKLNGALDLEKWLATLPLKDRQIVAGRAEGMTLKQIGRQIGMSFSGVRGRLQKLGAELARRMGVPPPQVA